MCYRPVEDLSARSPLLLLTGVTQDNSCKDTACIILQSSASTTLWGADCMYIVVLCNEWSNESMCYRPVEDLSARSVQPVCKPGSSHRGIFYTVL
jgi:hypothetical protein